MSTVVVGIDLSLTSTGLASTQGCKAHKPKDVTGLDRLHDIGTEVLSYVDTVAFTEGKVQMVAIEGPSYGSAGAGQHERAGLWWYVVSRLDDMGLDVAVIPPKTLKKYATGNGNAGKDAMLVAATRRFDWFNGGNDEADAVWLAAIAAELEGAPVVTVPQANRQALGDKVWWITDRSAA